MSDTKKYDSKYEDAGAEAANSHVRGIIQQLNQEKPSKEKSREVVVRPDGTKVIRVRKKRRVLVSESDKRKSGRKAFMMILLGGFCVCFALIGILLFRMSLMTGDAYVQKHEEALKEAWGAEKVTLAGAGVQGLDFHMSSVVAEFPEGSYIQRIELTDVSTDLDIVTFLTQRITADQLKIARAEVQLNEAVRELHIPHYQGEDLWRFNRVECEELNVSCGQNTKQVFALNNTHAYLYYPRYEDYSSCALVISGGTVQVRGMQNIRLKEAKIYISPRGVEDLSLTGTTDRPNAAAGQQKTSLSIAGRLPEGASLAGPYELDADNMRFADFTQGRFENIFTARTAKQAVGREHSRAQMWMPFDTDAPVFGGEFLLRNLCLRGLPVQSLLLQHMEAMKRKDYIAPNISQGRVVLNVQGDSMSLTFPEDQVVERDLIRLQGQIDLDGANDLSGKLSIGLPAILTHAEYADGKSDPIFREDAGVAWVSVNLSGTVNIPGDDSARLDAEAAESRSKRPGRLQLDAIDFEKVAEQIRRDREALDLDETKEPAKNDSQPFAPRGRTFDEMDSPLDAKGIFD